jgi:hypothetical protein
VTLNGYVEKEELYKIVDDKLKSLGITEDSYPLDGLKIANAYKDRLEVIFQPFPSLNLGGLLYKDPEDKLSIIGINSLKSKKAQNFDIIHELCHYWFHPSGEHLCYDSNFIYQNKSVEWQANEGTAQAIMPEILFKKRYIYWEGNINKLSNHFFATTTAVKYRIENLKLPSISKIRGLLYKSKKLCHCSICGNSDIPYRDNYCKICGIEGFISRRIGYKWSVYSKGLDKVNKCPKCTLKLDGNARYCNRCGAVSTSNYLLDPWYVELNIFDDTSICL